jgi:hypothetical protein
MNRSQIISLMKKSTPESGNTIKIDLVIDLSRLDVNKILVNSF